MFVELMLDIFPSNAKSHPLDHVGHKFGLEASQEKARHSVLGNHLNFYEVCFVVFITLIEFDTQSEITVLTRPIPADLKIALRNSLS